MKTRHIVIGAVVSTVVAGVVVSCGGGSGGGGAAATYTVGGTLSGATGNVTLKLNGANNLTQANGNFVFANQLGSGDTFNVQVIDAADRCTVANGAGAIVAANVMNVAVTCAAQGSEKVVRSAVLNFAQETPTPPTPSSGTGVGGVIYDPATNAISGGVTFGGLTGNPTGAHIHRADGNIVIGMVLASDNATAVLPVGATLTAPADIAELFAGTLYFNVHTVANSGGEIRGQINVQGGVGAAVAALNAAQESPASSSAATGSGTLIFDRATRNILITYITHNVTSSSAAHIHDSGGALTGPVIIGFPTQTDNFDGLGAGNNLAIPPAGSQVPSNNVSSFNLDYFYFNVHSGNNFCGGPCTLGEIRGNMTHLQ